MKTFNLTEHLLDQYRCDVLEYWINNEPANNNDNVVWVKFGG